MRPPHVGPRWRAGTTLALVITFGVPGATPAAEPVRVTEGKDAIDLDNGLVRAHFGVGPTGVRQEYFARAGRAWVPALGALRVPSPAPAGAAPLYADANTAAEFRLRTANALTAARVAEREPGRARVVLSGRAGAHPVEQTVTLAAGADWFHVEVRAELATRPPRLEFLLASFAFAGGSPDFTHAPCLKRAADDVAGDRVFHAPALVVQRGPLLAALVPDLDRINDAVVYAAGARGQRRTPLGLDLKPDPAHVSMPTALDLELQSGLTPLPVLSYGYLDFVVEPHVYWRHDDARGAMVRTLSAGRLRYAFDLFARADAPPAQGYRRVSRYLWERYGSRRCREPRPQALPLAEYARFCFPAAFAYRGDTLEDSRRYLAGQAYRPEASGPLPTWLDFPVGGRPAGGIRAVPSQWYHDVQFMAWWNNARDAVGLYQWGRRLHDPSLVDKARRIVNLALAAPQNQGLFPSVYRSNERRWVGTYWKVRRPYGPDAPAAHWDFASDDYQTAAASKTALHLLRYRRLCEDEPRILPYVRRYGEFLLAHADADGGVPAWFTADLRPNPHLRFNAEGGVHAWFLCELYAATRDRRYLELAERIAGFLTRAILPRQRWADFETFYSCAAKREDTFDAHTGQWPRCTLSMTWAVEGFTALHDATGDRRYLDAAEAVADYAGFYQAVWQPHFVVTAYAFGGMTSQNSDAEWLDMRQSQFAEACVRLGRRAGRQDLLERGVAALRASFALVNHPRHVANGIIRPSPFPPGLCPENIDHEGVPQWPLRSGFDWGEGGALMAAATVLDEIGGAYVDVARSVAVGVDGLRVRGFRLDGDTVRLAVDAKLLRGLPVPYERPYAAELRMAGLPARELHLVLNGGPPRAVRPGQGDKVPLAVRADGRVTDAGRDGERYPPAGHLPQLLAPARQAVGTHPVGDRGHRRPVEQPEPFDRVFQLEPSAVRRRFRRSFRPSCSGRRQRLPHFAQCHAPYL